MKLQETAFSITRSDKESFVKEEENHIVIPLEDILYISAGKDNCIIHTLERDHKITRQMKQ